jgi:hypothetical protein
MRQACPASSRGFANVVVHSVDVERIVLTATLKPGAREKALDLLQRSADASEQERVMQRQGIFHSDHEAVFFGVAALARRFMRWSMSPSVPPCSAGGCRCSRAPLHLARGAYFLDHGGDE